MALTLAPQKSITTMDISVKYESCMTYYSKVTANIKLSSHLGQKSRRR